VVRLTAAKFQPLVFSMNGLRLSGPPLKVPHFGSVICRLVFNNEAEARIWFLLEELGGEEQEQGIMGRILLQTEY
jgi:hypothetical protein